MAATGSLQVSVPDDYRKRVAKIAKAEGITQAQVMRDILTEAALQQREEISRQRLERL
jgi:hypothetical protein